MPNDMWSSELVSLLDDPVLWCMFLNIVLLDVGKSIYIYCMLEDEWFVPKMCLKSNGYQWL